MATTIKQLGQVRENSTDPVTVYSPAAATQTVIRNITICNQSGAAATFSLYLDDDGSVSDATTVLYNEEPINKTWSIDTFLAMNNSAGNLMIKSSVANALTITVSGVEVT